jgi:hypothetical protein
VDDAAGHRGGHLVNHEGDRPSGHRRRQLDVHPDAMPFAVFDQA